MGFMGNKDKRETSFSASLGPWGKSASNPALGTDINRKSTAGCMGAQANDVHAMRVSVVVASQNFKAAGLQKKS